MLGTLFFSSGQPQAQVNATWSATAPTGANWNDGANWDSNPVFPGVGGDIANFDQNAGGIAPDDYQVYVPNGADIVLGSLNFAMGADLFEIRIAPGGALSFNVAGQGVSNFESSGGQSFFIEGSSSSAGGLLTFMNQSSAELGGGTVQYIASYATAAGRVPGQIEFRNSSTASSAIIWNQGAFTANANGGATSFLDTSNAGTATIHNTGGTGAATFGGLTVFFDDSSAGSALLIAHGGYTAGAGFGHIVFGDTSDAANATITNFGAAATGAMAGRTTFVSSDNVGSPTINNLAGSAAGAEGGVTRIGESQSTFSPIIVNQGGDALMGEPGQTLIDGSSVLGDDTEIKNLGGTVSGQEGGRTTFDADSNAGGAYIANRRATVAGAGVGETRFHGQASAGSATIFNQGSTVAGAEGGRAVFDFDSTAASAMIRNFGTTIAGGSGASTQFFGDAGAGAAIILNFGSPSGQGGRTVFADSSRAENATLSAEGGAFAGGTIFFNQDSSGGSSRVILDGSGTLDISSHSNGVEIGSLESDVGRGGGGIVNLGGNELTVGNLNTSTTFSGVISGTGGLTKVGTGILNLTGVNTYSGDTTIDAGTLLANGVLASANVFVNPAGMLGGAGIIQGNVINAGIVSPGNSVGTLTIGGNYSQSGTLVIEIEGWNPGQYDVLAVGGSASLGGNLVLLAGPGLTYTRGDRAEFLTAAGGVSGEFDNVQNLNTGTILEAEIMYESNVVAVEIVQGSFAEFGEEVGDGLPDELRDLLRNTGLILDGVAFDSREAVLIAFLNGILLADLPALYFKIAPEELSVIHELGVSMADNAAGFFKRRAGEIRHGLRVPGNVTPSNLLVDPKNPKSIAPEVAAEEDLRWSTFAYGDATWLDLESSGTAPGYDTLSGGFSAGIDYKVSDTLTVGVMLSYTGSDADLHDDGDLEMNSYAANLYAAWQSGSWYLNALVGGAFNDFEYDRAALLGLASGDANGGALNAYLGGGYEIQQGGWRFGPAWSLHYTYVGYESFKEQGSLAPLEIQSNHTQSLRSSVGAEVAYVIKAGRRLVVPQVYVAWQHEFGDRSQATDFRFASGAGNVVTVEGPEVGRDALLLGASVSVLWSDRFSTFVGYNTQLLRDNYESHNLTAGLAWSF
ncbi:autotransporter outer membrane beta-barrel domain-containing protein [Phragmitibacter flavus]|uniref:autotransporter family protein n=1 Tax=Phragmitibacter flavus TaxID=2576071 RepID=UPI0014090701|nr:autotransporter outer membrane beta-barrel domain-containing protein [Phragmitibacter flavus]